MQAGKIKQTLPTLDFTRLLFQIDFSSLAKVSDGYCTAQIIDVIQNTLDETRLNLTKRRKVKGEEFMTLLAKEEPLYKEKEDAYSSWYVFSDQDLRTGLPVPDHYALRTCLVLSIHLDQSSKIHVFITNMFQAIHF